jgi:hypothetical protein
MLEDKQKTIAKMKKQVEKLDEEADMMESMGAGGESSPERSPEKGDMSGRTFKPKKTKMCRDQLERHRCATSVQYRNSVNSIRKQQARSRSGRKGGDEAIERELKEEI